MTKRHPALIPLTHDHHHALAQARRLRVAAESGDQDELLAQSKGFFEFFHDETIAHFREEEELVFPLVAGDERATPLITQILLEHLRLHHLVALLGAEIEGQRVATETATELAIALESHVRLEEGKVFPLLEQIAPQDRLGAVALSPRNRPERSRD